MITPVLACQSAGERRINIVQGQHYVNDDPDAVITTILGSCIAACIWDPAEGIGGMNHFLLPGEAVGISQASKTEAQRYGVHLMELLINDLLRKGLKKINLKAKLFGGACMIKGLTDVGALNAAFAEKFLREEGIELVGGSLRGNLGRRIQFWPASGRARQAFLKRNADSILHDESTRHPAALFNAGSVELFVSTR